jgi:hypothetical protein
MSTETKRKSAFVGLFVMVAVVLVAITFIVTKSSVATSYSVASPGMIHRAFVSYKDSDTVTIQPGYGECSLSYWEITSPVDHDMTSLATGEDWHYIYIDDVNSVYPTPTIKDSTVEPVWSDTKLGWYNGYDRCIGVARGVSGSSTISNAYSWNQTGFVDRGDPADWDFEVGGLATDEAWHDLDLSEIVPKGAKAVYLYVVVNDDLTNKIICFRENGNSNAANINIIRTYIAGINSQDSFFVSCDSNRVIEYLASNTTWTGIHILVRGWCF